MAAATLIFEERRRWEEKGIPRRIKVRCSFEQPVVKQLLT